MIRRFRFCLPSLVAALAALAVAGCEKKNPEEARAEAGQVARAVEQLRQADNAGKRPFLKALEATPCTVSDVCDAKKACVEAYGLEQTALDAVGAVRQKVRGGAEIAADTVELLTKAEHDLEAAHEKTKSCADLEGRLRQSYKL